MESTTAIGLSREARSIHAGLKVLLGRDVWAPANFREAEFQRKNLRRRYVHLLLLHGQEDETREAVAHLWMQTSYAFIGLYKARLARYAANASSNGKNTNANTNNANANNANTANNGSKNTAPTGHIVETRKLQQRLRQFLAEEERFYRALVQRVQRAYGVPGELLPGGEDEAPEGDRMNHFGFPGGGVGGEGDEEEKSDGEISSPFVAVGQRTLSKLLICLGDIARYREQYRPVTVAAAGKGRGHGRRAMEQRMNFSRARALYFAAHGLNPGDGNAANQLAILAGYESDTLAAVGWYLRALCVATPFETAAENLAGVLAKALPNAISAANSIGGDGDGPPKVRIDRFRREVVFLHALWSNDCPPGTEALANHLTASFGRLVAARALPEEMIVRVGVMAQGAVWRCRPDEATAQLTHVFALHTALLNVGAKELAEVDPHVASGSLAERISAEFRRTLPALRVSSKWILANWSWVRGCVKDLEMFWSAYALFIRLLGRTFPVAMLPVEEEMELEEDMDMRAWLPLGGLMGVFNSNKYKTPPEQVHPNVEQLMRIADLLRDGKKVVEMENSPLAVYGRQVVVGLDGPTSATAHEEDLASETTDDTSTALLDEAFSFLQAEPQDEDEEDEIVWDIRTKDVPVAAKPMAPIGTPARTGVQLPSADPPPRVLPAAQTQNHTLSPYRIPAQAPVSVPGPALPMPSPIAPPQDKIVNPTTAEDLLKGFLARGSGAGSVRASAASGIGLGSSASPAPASIWAASRAEQVSLSLGSPMPYGSPRYPSAASAYPQQQLQHQRFGSQGTIWAEPPLAHQRTVSGNHAMYGTLGSGSGVGVAGQTLYATGPGAAFAMSANPGLAHTRLPSTSTLGFQGQIPVHQQQQYQGWGNLGG
ncbi:unnamed protein product [Mycena citricolor]|uniref:DNA/RNA-binding domain-containing protein n=1 Tax=Mycena citricolor TaxID=2018698 RepID=A0AAD2Q0Y3_9AGAR|nr:unnamed protein product [Mycena citricolor]